MSRPSDHIDSAPADNSAYSDINQPKLSPLGWLRWFWRQLTSMRTALFLLLLLAIVAVPGSLVPQRSSDPNGVTQYFNDNPDWAPFLDSIQMFDVYTSVWFSAVYILLFISLIGCVIPRTKHHLQALRAAPPRTPANLRRLAGYSSATVPEGVSAASAIDSARAQLKKAGYRTALYDRGASKVAGPQLSVSAERGYARETGNLLFHVALIGVLFAVGIGGGFGYAGQKVLVAGGPSFSSTLLAFDSFNPGRFFDSTTMPRYTMKVDNFAVQYEEYNLNAIGQPIDYNVSVTTQLDGEDPVAGTIKVNEPMEIAGQDVFLLGNGYAPTITVRDADDNVVFTDSVPFLPQDASLTSLGVVKVPDGLDEQVGMIGFFYPTVTEAHSGAFTSTYPDLISPLLTLNVYTGDLGLDGGIPRSVYELDTDDMTQVAGANSDVEALQLEVGQTADLPNGLGTVSLDAVPRFVSLDIHYDPSKMWVLAFSVLALGSLLISLFIPRRRAWVKTTENADGSITIEYAALARGEDPTLDKAMEDLARKHGEELAKG